MILLEVGKYRVLSISQHVSLIVTDDGCGGSERRRCQNCAFCDEKQMANCRRVDSVTLVANFHILGFSCRPYSCNRPSFSSRPTDQSLRFVLFRRFSNTDF